MPIKPFKSIPQGLRDWSRFFDDTTVVPDDLTVDTSKIKNNAVTYAKLQNVTAARLIGNPTGIVANAQEIALGDALAFDGSALEVPDAAITYAKIQDVTNGTLLGRSSLGDGVLEEITPAAPLAIAAGALTIDLSGYAAKGTATVTAAFTGTTTDPAPVLRYSIAGALVTLYLPATTATSNATSFTVTGLPAGIRPARTQAVLCRVTDNGTVSIGIASIDATGVITFGLAVAGSAFTATGTKGFPLQSLCFSLD